DGTGWPARARERPCRHVLATGHPDDGAALRLLRGPGGLLLQPQPSLVTGRTGRERRSPIDWKGRAFRAGDPMKAHTEYLTFNIPSKMAYVNITPQVEEAVRKSGVAEGLVLVNSMHITSSVFINDDERGLHHDFGVWLEQLAPFNPSPHHYHHNRTGEDNADA